MSVDFIVETADAVVALLNAAALAGTLTPSFAAERIYDPKMKLEEIASGGLTVAVMSKSTTSEMQTRGSSNVAYRDDVEIDVGIWRHLNTHANSAVDPLMQLCRDICSVLCVTLTTASGLSCSVGKAPVRDPLYDFRMLLENGTFHSVITFTYRVSHPK